MGDDAEQDPLAGKTVGRYRVERLLDAGGMGRVYLAHDLQLGRRVALKILPQEFTANSSLVARFEQEARAASQLNHPNVLTVYEVGEDAGNHFIAAEYVEGETLRARMRRGNLSTDAAVEFGGQIASALAKAHQAGIIHRDIKPENVMVDEDGRARVVDFGIAKLTERGVAGSADAATMLRADTNPGTVLGTAAYMSPEQARGLAVDARTDVWSLGALLYEMIAGRPPFEGETPTDVIASVVKTDPRPLSAVTSDKSPELQWIVSKALRKNADERYQTAKELHADLLRVRDRLGAQRETSQTVSRAAYGGSGIRRHKWAALAMLAVLATTLAVLAYAYRAARDGAAEIRSVAVLPFENVAGDPETEYLSDGIAETLINSLSRLPGVRVIARTTSFSYKGRNSDARAVGRELGVDAVLTGRVVQRGEGLSIQTDLIGVADGTQLWGERYERKLADIINVQQQIARDVSERMRGGLTAVDREQASKRYTDNVEAYQLYLRGRFLWNKRAPEPIAKAVEHFNRAIELDPGFALAYSGLADCYAVPSSGLPATERMPKARAAARRAMELDDTLAEAHASLGSVLTDEWDWAGAEREYRRAIELNANYATARQWYAELLNTVGRVPEALAEIRRAQELDPLSPIIQMVAGLVLISAREYDHALAEFRKTLELDSGFSQAHIFMMRVYEWKGMYDEMFAVAKRDATLRRDPERRQEREQMIATLQKAYQVGGAREFRRKLLDYQLQARRQPGAENAVDIAESYSILGDKDQAFAWLNTAYDERDDSLSAIKTIPVFDPLRADPRYADLLRRMNLPQ